jgi:indole-3-glycerol phosphate synthase
MSASAGGNVLERIAGQVRRRIEEDRALESLDRLLARGEARAPRDFAAAFAGVSHAPGAALRVIAEVKRASPSEGAIANLDPAWVAREYLANGATALSILTERDSFGGSPEYLARIRAENPEALLLMKDFMVDDYQFAQARANGADCVLLIVALLGAEGTARFLALARERGLSALVEVHDEEELRIAAGEGATFIGVNNRDLKSLVVSLETSERLAGLAPAGATLISESGLRARAELERLSSLGYRGFLMGTTFMRTGQPGEALRKVLAP